MNDPDWNWDWTDFLKNIFDDPIYELSSLSRYSLLSSLSSSKSLNIRLIEPKINAGDIKPKKKPIKQVVEKKPELEPEEKSWRKKTPENKSSDEDSSDEEEVIKLGASGCYNNLTKKIHIKLESSLEFEHIEARVVYQDIILPESSVCDVTRDQSDAKNSLLRLLEISIDKVDRHVFHNSFKLVYSYAYTDNKKSGENVCFESTLHFVVPPFSEHLREATPFVFKLLGQFRPQTSIVKLFESDFKPETERLKNLLTVIDSYCRQPLANRSYKSVRACLETAQNIEDLECQRDLLPMQMEHVRLTAVNSYEDNYGWRDYDYADRSEKEYYFEMPGEHASLLKKMDLKEISVIIPYRLEQKKTRCKDIVISAKIVEVLTNFVFIRTSFDFRNLSVSSISFEFNRISTRASLNALNSINLSLMPYLSDFAEPPIGWEDKELKHGDVTSRFAEEDFVWFNPQLGDNKEQRIAIQNIVNCTAFPFPYVIFGPPGTGKTSALVECVVQISKLKPEAKILITAQSNSACDEIGSRLLRTISLSKILRIYSSTLERGKKDNLNKKLLSSSNMRNGHNQWPTKEEFGSFKIVIITLMSSSRLVQSNLEKRHFDYIFLDECGAASEPESLVPLLGLGTQSFHEKEFGYYEDDFFGNFVNISKAESAITANIVILGDHKQLGAVINSHFAEKMGLGISLMERMMTKKRYKPNPEYDTNYVTQLLDNYRCHPAILQFSNAQFYENMLRSKVDESLRTFAERWELLPKPGFPVLFHCLKTPSEVDPRGTSSFNDAEVDQVKFYVDYLLNSGVNGKKVEISDIGIVSPYLAQLKKLRSVLGGAIEIGSAEYYQGREKKVIIISTVKSGTGIGFLKSEKRLNVMLTRAQSLMIVVGNAETLQIDSLWRSFVHFCRNNNAIAGETFNLTPLSAKDDAIVVQMTTALKTNAEGAEEEVDKPHVKLTLSEMKERLSNVQEMLKNL